MQSLCPVGSVLATVNTLRWTNRPLLPEVHRVSVCDVVEVGVVAVHCSRITRKGASFCNAIADVETAAVAAAAGTHSRVREDALNKHAGGGAVDGEIGVIGGVLDGQISDREVVVAADDDALRTDALGVDGHGARVSGINTGGDGDWRARRAAGANCECFVVLLARGAAGNVDRVAGCDAVPADVGQGVPCGHPGHPVAIGEQIVIDVPLAWSGRDPGRAFRANLARAHRFRRTSACCRQGRVANPRRQAIFAFQ